MSIEACVFYPKPSGDRKMSSEKEEKKVLSRREALKRIAVLGAGVAAAAVGGASFAGCYTSETPARCPAVINPKYGKQDYCSASYYSCSG